VSILHVYATIERMQSFTLQVHSQDASFNRKTERC